MGQENIPRVGDQARGRPKHYPNGVLSFQPLLLSWTTVL